MDLLHRFTAGLAKAALVSMTGLTLLAAPALVGSAQAALITQTLTFTLDGFSHIGGGPFTPPISSVSGSIVFTYDDATTSDITGQAVDSISFDDPTGVFETSDVFFDLRLPPNVGFPTHTYEFDFYHTELAVAVGSNDDWLLRLAAVNVLGADFSFVDSGPVAAQFLHSETTGRTFYSSDVASMSSTSAAAATGSVPAPGALALMGLGLAGLGFASRRRSMPTARVAYA